MAKAKLKVGDVAPDFKLLNQEETPISLKDFQGKWLVFYFYPKDNTPGCTIEAIDFTALAKDFAKLGAVVVGVSKDSCGSHQSFIEKQKLGIMLLSDPKHAVIEAYGSWAMKKFMGKEFMGIIRSTFLIDPKGKLAFIWPNVSAKGHAEEVLAKLKELV